MADQERLRVLGAGVRAWRAAVGARAGTAAHHKAVGVLVRWRRGPDPLRSRDPGRQGGKEVGRVARARGCGRACACAGALWVRGHRWTPHVWVCLRASVPGGRPDACVGARVWGHA